MDARDMKEDRMKEKRNKNVTHSLQKKILTKNH